MSSIPVGTAQITSRSTISSIRYSYSYDKNCSGVIRSPEWYRIYQVKGRIPSQYLRYRRFGRDTFTIKNCSGVIASQRQVVNKKTQAGNKGLPSGVLYDILFRVRDISHKYKIGVVWVPQSGTIQQKYKCSMIRYCGFGTVFASR